MNYKNKNLSLFNRVVLLCVVTITLLVVTSCGTITGLTSKVMIDSNPQGADILLNNRQVGKTPMILKLKNSKDYDLSIQYENSIGYSCQITSDISPWCIIADCFLISPFSFVIDACTGGFYESKELDEKKVFHDFTKGKTTITDDFYD